MTQNTQIQERKHEALLTNPIAEPNSLMRERKEVLLGLFQENLTHVRHSESQMTTATNIVLLATVGLIGLVQDIRHEDWPLAMAIILVGLFGTVFNANQRQQIRCYKARAEKYYEALDNLIFEEPATLKQILAEAANDEPRARFPKLLKLSQSHLLRSFWPLAISIIAALFMTYMVLGIPPKKPLGEGPRVTDQPQK
jgi:hypothetical protein